MSQARCVFCRIVAGGEPAALVYESPEHLVFMDHKPINRGHVLIMPRSHYGTLLDMPSEEVGPLFTLVHRVATAIREAVHADGIHVGVNNGKAANQIVFHVHVHLVPRYLGDAPQWELPRRRNATWEELEEVAGLIRASMDAQP